LPLFSFLQACFVWYGLVHFWRLAESRGTFAPEQIRRHVDMAVKGFWGVALIDYLAPDREKLAHELLCAIEEMQLRVKAIYT
jgi:hypothetical protein